MAIVTPDDLTAVFLSELPSPLREFWDRIEFGPPRRPIVVRLAPPRIEGQNPLSMSMDTSRHDAKLYARQRQNFPLHSAAHELIHLKRQWLDGIPFVIADDRTERSNKIAKVLNDMLEHVAMAEAEKELGFDPISYWDRTLGEGWKMANPTLFERPFARKFYTLLNLLQKDIIRDETYAMMKSDAEAVGLHKSVSFAESVHKTIRSDKIVAARAVRSFLSPLLPPLSFQYMDGHQPEVIPLE